MLLKAQQKMAGNVDPEGCKAFAFAKSWLMLQVSDGELRQPGQEIMRKLSGEHGIWFCFHYDFAHIV